MTPLADTLWIVDQAKSLGFDLCGIVRAEQFPELLSILPPKRKPWQSEDYRMGIFDAAAIGIAYLAQHERVP